ncbi:unnamed protein product [Rotaria sp. Silwood1]|nr:unnamed protein product [Rotaria sp. Silwood1]CAF5111899.1 unnamed protein product [Rotaria sp. Silwood1]
MQHKIEFIQTGFIELVSSLNATKTGNWGKMNAQQMVEHIADFFKVSTGKIVFALTTPVEHLPKYKEFLLSDKAFKENTKAPVLPEEPLATRNSSMQNAIEELRNEINEFSSYFEENKLKTTLHPAFGELNFDEWVLLHYKHLQHHAKQFGLI